MNEQHSKALQRAEDVQTGATLVNSPGQIAKLRLSVPGPVQAIVRLGGGAIHEQPPHSRGQHVETYRNRQCHDDCAGRLFDMQYMDPASDQNRQDAIAQNGRALRVGLSWKLWKK